MSPGHGPPGPRSLPVVGAMRRLRGDRLARLTALRETYGGVVSLGAMAGALVTLVSSPAAVTS
jgi:hypothetical protein